MLRIRHSFKRIHRGALACSWVVALAWSASGVRAQDSQERILSAGDTLNVTVQGREDLSGRFIVDGAGELLLPRAGVIPASGFTPSQLALRIAEAHRPYLGDVRVWVVLFSSGPATPVRTPAPARAQAPPPTRRVQTDSLVTPPTRNQEGLAPPPGETIGGLAADSAGPPEIDAARAEAAPALMGSIQLRASTVPVAVAAAQPDPVADERETNRPGTAARFSGAVMGGVAPISPSIHGFGGVMLDLSWGRFGINGSGQYGSGAGYSSTLLLAGLSIHLSDPGTSGFSLTAGGSYYAQEADSGYSRSGPGLTAGIRYGFPIGGARTLLGVNGVLGNYGDEGESEESNFRFLRFYVGLGW